MKALIDSDIIIYRVGFTTEDVSESIAMNRLDQFICNLLCFDLPDCYEWELLITGHTNFRVDVATTAPYKGNRKSEKPKYYKQLREHIVNHWKASVIEGMEADDMLAILHEQDATQTCIVTLDKDLDQVEGLHYNFVKRKFYCISKQEGLENFYMQFLIGDSVDNIKGAAGIGPVKAKKLIEGTTEQEMWDTVVDKLGMSRAIENGHLLYMLRTVDDSFIKYLNRQGLDYEA